MKNLRKLLGLAVVLVMAQSTWAAKVGEPAPEFALKDENGKVHKLSDNKGKIVVLEWFNKDCPFVEKHYEGKKMQELQDKYAGKVVWYTIISSAKGKQGYLDKKGINAVKKDWNVKNTVFLIDANGKVGKAYDAKVTPHMYIINKDGQLVYNGAIDSIKSTDQEDLAKATNYVDAALTAMLSTPPKSIEVATSVPYGCGVKF